MMNKMINYLLCSESLFQLADRLDDFIHFLDTSDLHKNQFCYALHLELNMRLNSIYKHQGSNKPYILYTKQAAVLAYWNSHWLLAKDYKVNKRRLSEVSSHIRENFIDGYQDIISVETIDRIIEMVNSRFDFTNKVLSGQKIKVAILECEHREFDSFYSATITSEDIFDYIMLLGRHEPENNLRCTHESIFLHEVGHMLHTRVTGKLFTVPDEFVALQKIILDSNRLTTFAEPHEVFADLFAVAATLDSEVYQKVPLNSLINSNKDYIFQYMYYMTNCLAPGFK